MKYSTTYQITAAQITAQYRLTIDGLLTFHENTIARYLTTLGLAAFDVQKKDMTWVITEIYLSLPEPPTMWSENVEMTVWVSEMGTLRESHGPGRRALPCDQPLDPEGTAAGHCQCKSRKKPSYMKRLFILAAAILTLLFVGCSKDNPEPGKDYFTQ